MEDTLATTFGGYDTNLILDTINVGETYLDDKFRISFLSLDTDFLKSMGSEKVKAKAGYQVIAATFEIENINAYSLYSSIYCFDCNADGSTCEFFINPIDSSSPLEIGKKNTVTVYFEVPSSASNIVLNYTTNLVSNNKVACIVK